MSTSHSTSPTPSTPPGYEIRFTEMTDQPYVENWLQAPGGCDEYSFDLMEMPEAVKNWIGFCKYKASLTATLFNEPCAVATLFLMPYRKVAHHCSFYVIVDPAHQKKGIGYSMVRNVLHLARTRFRLESVHVEVFDPSPLLPILQKLQFQLFARQERYLKTDAGYRARLLLEHFFT